ncbi:uncharacterized protein [Physcomitrium patens]|nr:short-chain dehydrogenase/reductase family 42E member 1-like isoform X2 [Physcomitrium patens]XP_024391473.1 short-chain dehydrogenase/reductase family 42E member 1-like isoform X2 [Physcomitrium patens]|eukprot:XP_024391472.1 short-chain dehydrogenase/reductase family 42E member 1-like isoform X2 [Physcomitrella patens]
MASFGMSGKEMLQSRHIDEVNVDGTCHILDSCAKCGVRRLVYTSTYNVVYGGQEIRNGTENLPYFPIEKHVDPYGRSKALAEQFVIRSSGRPLGNKKGKRLYTCALRPAAIYGPGEQRHFPRIIQMARLGLLKFRIGGPNILTDWVYGDNLVHAQLLASMALIDDLPGRSGIPPAAGQAYFISDGAPLNSFELIKPIVEGVGYTMPQRELSVKSAMTLAWGMYAFYGLLYPWLQKSWIPEPFILPAEVFKVGVTHYCSTWKARQEIGYTAIVDKKDALDRTVTYWKERHSQELDGPPLLSWIFLLGGMFLLFLCVYVPAPFMGPLEFIRWIGLFIFRSQETLRIILYLACLAHLLEGIYAWIVAMKADRKNARGWFWQTLALGYPSLQYLLKRAEKKKLHQK